MVMLGVPFVQSIVNRLWNQPMLAGRTNIIMRQRAFAEVGFALAAKEIVCLVQIDVLDDKHFRQVDFAFALSNQFRFDERGRSKTPASARVALRFNIGCFDAGLDSEFVWLRFCCLLCFLGRLFFSCLFFNSFFFNNLGRWFGRLVFLSQQAATAAAIDQKTKQKQHSYSF